MNRQIYSAERDLRVDFFRGIALLFIFVDHVPGNIFGKVTLRNFGFSDAAELFVFIAGFSAVLAYGRRLENDPLNSGVPRIGARVRTIYLWHMSVMLAGGVLLYAAAAMFGDQKYVANIGFVPFAENFAHAVLAAFSMLLQPNLFNILPLYVVLLTVFPAVYVMLRWNFPIGLVVLSAVWLLASFTSLNLPVFMADGAVGGWFLNPFCWLLLFGCGSAAAMAIRRGAFPKSQPLLVLCGLYLCFGVLFAAPWTAIPGLEQWRLIPPDALGKIDKTYLSVWRLMHILALAYIGIALIAPQADWLRLPAAEVVSRIGRHSLEVFSLGIILSLMGWVVLSEVGQNFVTQLMVNAVGISVLGGSAWLLSGGTLQASGQQSASKRVTIVALARTYFFSPRRFWRTQ